MNLFTTAISLSALVSISILAWFFGADGSVFLGIASLAIFIIGLALKK